MPIRSMFLRYGLPLLALVGLGVGAVAVTSNRPESNVVDPRRLPPSQPESAGRLLGASGVIEAEGRNVSIGSAVAGPISALYVTPGQSVMKGDPLFAVDPRELGAQVAVRRADIVAAQRAVEVARATVAEAQANREDRRAQLARALAVSDPRAIAAEEVSLRRFALQTSDAQFARAEAQLREAQATVGQSSALLGQARTLLGRTTVRSPMAGTVLQVNARPGQFAPAGEAQTALIVIGRTSPLNLRVDVDENDVPRIALGQPAQFSVRGDGRRKWSARFVRVEPLLVNKANLSGAAGERVDTRVLQVLYAFDPAEVPAYVGQQVDVFIPATVQSGRQSSTVGATAR